LVPLWAFRPAKRVKTRAANAPAHPCNGRNARVVPAIELAVEAVPLGIINLAPD
jgi:hypothetical protein